MRFAGKSALLTLFLSIAPVALVLAQESCPAIVQTALTATDNACAATGRNQVCYGNLTLEAEPQAGISDFSFEQTGDLANVADIQTLRLSSMNADIQAWGVALMKLQANLPDSLPGQNVTILLFGEVEIENRVTPQSTQLDMTATAAVNIRLQPSTDAAVLQSLAPNEVITAVGRLEDLSWIQIMVGGDARQVGWVSAQFLKTAGDVHSLTVVEPSLPVFGPMQSFYFTSGIGDAPCVEAPDSGILIQTPEGAGKVNLRVNEVNIELSSTAYLQAQVGADMTVNVIEGQAQVEVGGTSVFVPEGGRVQVPLDAAGAATGAPLGLESYVGAELAALPVIPLEREIIVAPALTDEQIQVISQGITGTFDTTYGTMIFSSDGHGTYDYDSGRLSYQVSGNVITGYWVEATSARPCEAEQDGSHNWGRMRFEFNATFTAFVGTWGYCEEEPASSWDGTRAVE